MAASVLRFPINFRWITVDMTIVLASYRNGHFLASDTLREVIRQESEEFSQKIIPKYVQIFPSLNDVNKSIEKGGLTKIIKN